MAISAISNATAAANTVTMPTEATGDYILATVWRTGSTTAPTIPSGWTLIKTTTSTTCWGGIYYKVAASSSETTGTWTSATSVEINVYRGVGSIGTSTSGVGSSTSITYPAVTLTKTNSTSWVYRAAMGKTMTNMLTNVPTGYTARGGIATPTGDAIRGCDSNAGLASSPSTGTQAVSPTSIWLAFSVELVATVPPGAAISTLSDDFNTGSTPNVAKWIVSGTVTQSGGDLVVGASGGELDSVATYDLRAGSGYFQARAVTSGVFFTAADQNGGSAPGWNFNSSSQAEAALGTVGSGTTRTHTSGDWYRVRESSGTLFWDYSTDGTNWTNLHTDTSVGVTNVLVTWANTGSSAVHFDNFNTVPAATNTGAFFAMF